VKLNATARTDLQLAGISPAQWARANYMPSGEWSGDACGCPDSRCIGHHHIEPENCACLPVLLEDYFGWIGGAESCMFDDSARPARSKP